MAKRVADRQLTQLNQHEDDDSSDAQSAGFRRADDSELARRVIRKPKSRLRSANNPESTAQPKPAAFSGFAGFAPTSSADSSAAELPSKPAFSGFSFGQTTAAAADAAKPSTFGAAFKSADESKEKPSTFGAMFKPGGATDEGKEKPPAFGAAFKSADEAKEKPSGFGAMFKPGGETKETPTFSFGAQKSTAGFTFGQAKPAASSFSMPAFKPPTANATPATTGSGMFASGTAAAAPKFSGGFVPPGAAKQQPLPKPDSKPDTSADDDEFYRHIRGLNVSIQTKINDAIATNAFVDLTPLLEQYRRHWDQVTQDHPSADASASSQPDPTIPATSAEPAKFSFGAASPSKPPPASGASGFSFSFGKPAASTADDTATKPAFSFGFAKPPAAADPASPPQKPFSFGFGKPAAAEPAASDNADDASDHDADDPEPAIKSPTTAGEEGEATVHRVRGKVYQWDAAHKRFMDLGVGNLRINTWDAESGAKRARVLCRQESTEKITLNASMFANMMVERKDNDKNVGLLAVVDGKPTRYMLRVKTANEAKELKEAMEKVIATL
ncbi:hypothetical protein H4R23_000995 [Coemansia sp. Cherry 401B]|nr:hypothetical protein IWW52_001018 [Coemansia sp. RSA 2704]KAJ2738674.1 hypothetical protein H4R23_000995 [Coemansia sp. Cherry 401B]